MLQKQFNYQWYIAAIGTHSTRYSQYTALFQFERERERERWNLSPLQLSKIKDSLLTGSFDEGSHWLPFRLSLFYYQRTVCQKSHKSQIAPSRPSCTFWCNVCARATKTAGGVAEWIIIICVSEENLRFVKHQTPAERVAVRRRSVSMNREAGSWSVSRGKNCFCCFLSLCRCSSDEKQFLCIIVGLSLQKETFILLQLSLCSSG